MRMRIFFKSSSQKQSVYFDFKFHDKYQNLSYWSKLRIGAGRGGGRGPLSTGGRRRGARAPTQWHRIIRRGRGRGSIRGRNEGGGYIYWLIVGGDIYWLVVIYYGTLWYGWWLCILVNRPQGTGWGGAVALFLPCALEGCGVNPGNTVPPPRTQSTRLPNDAVESCMPKRGMARAPSSSSSEEDSPLISIFVLHSIHSPTLTPRRSWAVDPRVKLSFGRRRTTSVGCKFLTTSGVTLRLATDL